MGTRLVGVRQCATPESIHGAVDHKLGGRSVF